MQILQWLFKGAHEQERESTLCLATKREDINDQNTPGKDIILHEHRRAYRRTKGNEEKKLGCKNLKIFAFISRKDIPKTCFYGTLNLKRLGNFNRRLHFVYSMKLKREETSIGVGISNTANLTSHVGKKVLPISQASFSSSTSETKGDERKPISRMKELLKWAATAKTERGGKISGPKVLQFRRRETVKTVPGDDQVSIDSPKISFRWDVESCSTTSSAYSAISIASSSKIGETQVAPSSIFTLPAKTDHITCRKGNWITTDSEFVVLEL